LVRGIGEIRLGSREAIWSGVFANGFEPNKTHIGLTKDVATARQESEPVATDDLRVVFAGRA